MVNFGVSFLHRRVTEKIEKPIDDVIPNTNPNKDAFPVLPKAMIIIPTVARIIAIQTFRLILSQKKETQQSSKKRHYSKT